MVTFLIATMSCRLLGISLPPGVQVAVRFVFFFLEQLKWQTRRLCYAAGYILICIYICLYYIYCIYIVFAVSFDELHNEVEWSGLVTTA